ncbi:MAG: sulfurtransferase-like selenium metabolism protein YedF [Clostridiales bacterium]|nr:sulfurtransferase-like selenium metabolism protein YedF [Clostridiales bacterium]
MEKISVNAMGDQCPIPVIKTRNTLNEIKEPTIIEVEVDNEVAVQNVTRFAASKNMKAKAEILVDKHFRITIDAVPVEGGTVAKDDQEVDCGIDRRGNTVVVVNSATMGIGNDELGKVLMKGFIYAVSQLEELPSTILFYNGGVNISTEGSASLEDLKSMEAQGVTIKTCGTCLDYYNLKEKLAVGTITNMYDIVETMNNAAHIIRP